MEEDKSLPIRERIAQRALAKKVADALKPFGLDAQTPRPAELGDRVSVTEHDTASTLQRKHAGEKGVVVQVEYLGSYDEKKYEPGTFLTQRWNPAQSDLGAEDFAVPIEQEKIEARKEHDRRHDWRVHVQLESGERVALWPYHIVPEITPEQQQDMGFGL